MLGSVSESTPLLHQSIPVQESPPVAKGFIIGDDAQNNKYGQEIMDAATSNRLLWPRLKPVLKNTIIELVTTAATITSTYYGTLKLFANKEASAADLVLVNSYALASSKMIEPLKGIGEALLFPPKGDKLAAGTMKIAITRIDEEVEPLLSNLPEETRKGIQGKIDNLKTIVYHVEEDAAYNRNPQFLKKSYNDIIGFLSFPYTTPNAYQYDREGVRERGLAIDAAQDKLIKSYPTKIQESLNDVMDAHRQASIGDTTLQPFHIFEGPPAVGKTYAVKEMAKALRAKLIQANGDDLADFLRVPRSDGKKLKAVFDSDLWEFREQPGKIWTQIRENITDGNFILFIDELSFTKNKNLLPNFKSWMTGNAQSIPNSPDLFIDNKYTIIAASNEELYDQLEDDAAKSRVTTYIKFPHWSREELKTRTDEYVNMLKERRLETKYPEPSQKTHEDLCKLVDPILEVIHTYELGTFSLRDIHACLNKFSNRFQKKNDMGTPYNIDDYLSKIDEDFTKILKDRNSDIQKMSPVAGGEQPEDIFSGELFSKTAGGELFFQGYEKRRTRTEDIYPSKSSMSDTPSSSSSENSRPKLHAQLENTISTLTKMSDEDIRGKFHLTSHEEKHGSLVKQSGDLFYFQRHVQSRQPSLFVLNIPNTPTNFAPQLGTTISDFQKQLTQASRPPFTTDGKGKSLIV